LAPYIFCISDESFVRYGELSGLGATSGPRAHVAEGGELLLAKLAGAASDLEGDDDTLAKLEVLDVRSHLMDEAHEFVTENVAILQSEDLRVVKMTARGVSGRSSACPAAHRSEPQIVVPVTASWSALALRAIMYEATLDDHVVLHANINSSKITRRGQRTSWVMSTMGTFSTATF
jgi:hypothetical protein